MSLLAETEGIGPTHNLPNLHIAVSRQIDWANPRRPICNPDRTLMGYGPAPDDVVRSGQKQRGITRAAVSCHHWANTSVYYIIRKCAFLNLHISTLTTQLGWALVISFNFNSTFRHLVPYEHQRQVPNIFGNYTYKKAYMHAPTNKPTHTDTLTHGSLFHTNNYSSRNKHYSMYRLLSWRTYIIYHILYFFTGGFGNFRILFTDIK